MDEKPRIASVTVAFDPRPEWIAEQIAALRPQVDQIVIVDNGSSPAVAAALRAMESAAAPAVRVIALGANLGVGAAFNTGIRQALDNGCGFIVLLDHDSVPATGMVASLLAAFREGSLTHPVAAVGPRVRDSRDGHEFPFIRLGWTHNPRLRCLGEEGNVECDFLISSGTFVSREAIERVGPLDASLFIDFVDLDWCCKARSMGYALHGACGARLEHRLGEEPRSFAGGFRVLAHPPERTYYMTRNRLLLYQRGYVPMKWKMKDVVRAVVKLATAALFLPPRLQHLRMALLAVGDGLRRRGGKRDDLRRVP